MTIVDAPSVANWFDADALRVGRSATSMAFPARSALHENLARWHEEEAARAERAAALTRLPMQRARHRAAARWHRECAALTRAEA